MRVKRLTLGVLLITTTFVGPAPAADTAPTWNCRASTGYLVLPPNPLTKNRVEPLVANGSIDSTAPDRPRCADDDAGPSPLTLSGAPGSIQAAAAQAHTRSTDEAMAAAGVAQARVVGGTTEIVSAGLLQATAHARCEGTVPLLSGTSLVDDLKIGGTPVPVPPGSAPSTITTPLATVYLNEEVRTADALVKRALRVTLPGGAEFVLAEAKVSFTPGMCQPAGSTNTNTQPGGVAGNTQSGSNRQLCPQGSRYESPSNRCVIYRSNGSVIVVGRPGDVPTGGRVMTLQAAQKLAGSTRCLKKGGKKGKRKGKKFGPPAFAIVGTRGKDNITGTNRRDRIVTLAGRDKVEGGRGHDCVTAGKGNDTLSGALGKDRLFGGPGRDALIGGSHRDRLVAGKGNDSINSGYGRDRIKAGAGKDAINVATAGPPARVHCGKGRDTLRGNRNERRKTKRCEKRYFLR